MNGSLAQRRRSGLAGHHQPSRRSGAPFWAPFWGAVDLDYNRLAATMQSLRQRPWAHDA